jgi:hypothetical protein
MMFIILYSLLQNVFYMQAIYEKTEYVGICSTVCIYTRPFITEQAVHM